MDLYEIRKYLNVGKSIFDLPLRVTFYARVSTGTDEQANSLKNQISYFSDFIAKNPNWTYVEGYIDEATSGMSVAKRESFLNMIDDAKKNKFDFIVTKEISRFSRSTFDSIKYTQKLLEYGVGVLFQSDNINTLMPDAELRLTIMASLAQDELRRLSERVKFGFKEAIGKGVVLGNDRIWGYTKKNGVLYIDENEAELVRIVFNMYATENKGMRVICNWLTENGYKNQLGNDFSPSSLKGILRNPKYKGFYCGNKYSKLDYRSKQTKELDESEWVIYKDEKNVPPIVSEELWQRANDIFAARSAKMALPDKSAHSNRYSYSGKVFCAEHGVFYHRKLYKYKSGDREVWHCKEYVEKGRKACTSPAVYTSELDAILKEVYSAIITEKETIVQKTLAVYAEISGKSVIKDDIARVKANIASVSAKKDKLLDLAVEARISDEEFERRNDLFNVESEQLKHRLRELETAEKENYAISEDIEAFRTSIEAELDFEEGFTEHIVNSLVDRIVVQSSEDKKIINLDVHLKFIDTQFDCIVNRKSGVAKEGAIDTTSFCDTPSRSSARIRSL